MGREYQAIFDASRLAATLYPHVGNDSRLEKFSRPEVAAAVAMEIIGSVKNLLDSAEGVEK